LACSHHKTESDLGPEAYTFIQNLGILDKNEEIELFETNGGFAGWKQSGNFITPKRIASYWIEGEERQLGSALFASEVDSLAFREIKHPGYASFLEVHKKDGSRFKVYVDADSARTHAFVHRAKENWLRARGME
jgi:hypothetical protein